MNLMHRQLQHIITDYCDTVTLLVTHCHFHTSPSHKHTVSVTCSYYQLDTHMHAYIYQCSCYVSLHIEAPWTQTDRYTCIYTNTRKHEHVHLHVFTFTCTPADYVHIQHTCRHPSIITHMITYIEYNVTMLSLTCTRGTITPVHTISIVYDIVSLCMHTCNRWTLLWTLETIIEWWCWIHYMVILSKHMHLLTG